jgi:hypothetical protein
MWYSFNIAVFPDSLQLGMRLEVSLHASLARTALQMRLHASLAHIALHKTHAGGSGDPTIQNS